MIPTDLKNSEEYKELMNLKRHRKELQEVKVVINFPTRKASHVLGLGGG